MRKLVHSYENIKDKILEAAKDIANPVRQTMSPQGKNVIFETDSGKFVSTNDGVTIAKNIDSNDDIKQGFIDIIKETALQTNNRVGDGTSTSILVSYVLLREVFKALDDGATITDIKKYIDQYRDDMLEAVDSLKMEVDDDILHNIAEISANNDSELAEKVMEIIGISGTDGMINLERGGDTTELEIDEGFIVHGGILEPEFLNEAGKFDVSYTDVPVLITDKRLYYKNEVRKIMEVVINAGYKDVVIVARDFIGESKKALASLHNSPESEIRNVLPVKDPFAKENDPSSLKDLALYLNGKMVSESSGEMVTTLSFEDFCIATDVKSNPNKTVINRQEVDNKELDKHIEGLREKKENNPEDEESSRRLAALTNGMVTVKVGANTDIEKTELIFRYEDSINATRSAMREGALRGGGMSMWTAWKMVQDNDFPFEFMRAFEKASRSPVEQILENSDENIKNMIEELEEYATSESEMGYNAKNREISNLVTDGVVDAADSTVQAIKNATSVVKQIITSNYLILKKHVKEEGEQGDKDGE